MPLDPQSGLGRVDVMIGAAWGLLASIASTPIVAWLTRDFTGFSYTFPVNVRWTPGLLRVPGSIALGVTVAVLVTRVALRRPPRSDLSSLDRAVLTSAAGFATPLAVALPALLLSFLTPIPPAPVAVTAALLSVATPFLVGRRWLCRQRRSTLEVGLLHAIGTPCLVLLAVLLLEPFADLLRLLGVSRPRFIAGMIAIPLSAVSSAGLVYLQYWVEER